MGERGSYTVPSSFDVVGIRLGMTQEEAMAVVQARKSMLNGKPIAFDLVKERKHDVLVKGAVPRTWFVNLSDAKSVLAAFDLTEERTKAPRHSGSGGATIRGQRKNWKCSCSSFPMSPTKRDSQRSRGGSDSLHQYIPTRSGRLSSKSMVSRRLRRTPR